jgi:hypothetical protein
MREESHIEGIDKIMERLDSIGIKMFALTALQTLVMNIFPYSYACLLCAVPLSLHNRLCSVTFLMKLLQNWRPVRFFKEDRLLVRI